MRMLNGEDRGGEGRDALFVEEAAHRLVLLGGGHLLLRLARLFVG